MKITSAQNPRVKQAAKLRNARERARQGRIIVDGVREIARALEGHVAVREYYVCESLCSVRECKSLLERLAATNAERFDVTPAVFEKLAYGDRAEGVIAVADTPRTTLSDVQLPSGATAGLSSSVEPLVAVLEGVEKPGNIGAVLRSADGASVSALVTVDCADLFNPNAIRASLGTIFTMPVCSAGREETIAWLRQNKLTIYAARVDGAMDYTACDFTRPCAIVLGSEAEGLSDDWRGTDITAVRLPMRGIADSLNVSAAAAVLFYEALRQRTQTPLPVREG